MKRAIKRIIKIFLKFILIFFTILFIFLFIVFVFDKDKRQQKIVWGVNFSQKHSQNLGLDWKQNYLAILDDLKVKNIKILTHWDILEFQKDKYYFDDLDWQINEANKRNVNIILVVGMKTGRWPECHIPNWAHNLSKQEQQKEILGLIENIILRYRNYDIIKMWQVENEPFFSFGNCPWKDKDFLKKEIELVKILDYKKRKIIVSDSGEWSLWVSSSKQGDVVGITMYRKVWNSNINSYISYDFLRPFWYWVRAFFVDKFFGKKVIVVEFQAEPWGPKLLYDIPLSEQKKTMTLEKFNKNIEFAKKNGFDEFYLWGAEWWYWLKVNYPEDENSFIWEKTKELLNFIQ